MQEVYIWPYEEMVNAQTRTCLQKGDVLNSLRFVIQTDQTRPSDSQQKKKKRICQIVDFIIRADSRVKVKESEKGDKYLDLARELKKLWNMKVTVIQGAYDKFPEFFRMGTFIDSKHMKL